VGSFPIINDSPEARIRIPAVIGEAHDDVRFSTAEREGRKSIMARVVNRVFNGFIHRDDWSPLVDF